MTLDSEIYIGTRCILKSISSRPTMLNVYEMKKI